MKQRIVNGLLCLCALLATPPLAAIGFDEVRDFEEVFVISAEAPSRNRVDIHWAIAEGYYLYNNKFLRVTPATEGVEVGDLQVPPGEVSFDELLGEEVEKYHHDLTVTVTLDSVPAGAATVELNVRSQGCLENVLC